MANKYVSVVTGGTNSAPTTAAEVNAVATDFISSGVIGTTTNTSGVSPATGAFAVNAQGTPDMTVAVTGGVAYVTATPAGGTSQMIRVFMDAAENVTIASNSSGSTKYDWIYISLNATNLANPAVTKDNVATLVRSRSTSSSSDDGTPPTYGKLIAIVTVANGASSITNGNITDSRVGATIGETDTWQTWSPTFANITVGNGSLIARYIRVGKIVYYAMTFQLGSTSSVGTGPTFTLPVTANPHGLDMMFGWVTDAGVNDYVAPVCLDSSTVARWRVFTIGSAGVITSSVTATSPFTFGTGDILGAKGWYEIN